MNDNDLKYCLCGCGKFAKLGNTFINHHNRKGKPSYGLRGRKLSDEHIEKLRKSHQGVKHSEFRNKQSSERAKKQWQDVEFVRKQKEVHRGFIPSKEDVQKRAESLRKIWQSPEYRTRLSDTFKKKWRDPTFAEMMGKAWRVHPNKSEIVLLNLLNDLYPGEWKFTGDFSFTINGNCPDFVNCNGQKKIIELFGDYWHRGDNPQDRINIFKEFGYETLIIWEHELKNVKVVEHKIAEFCYEKENPQFGENFRIFDEDGIDSLKFEEAA